MFIFVWITEGTLINVSSYKGTKKYNDSQTSTFIYFWHCRENLFVLITKIFICSMPYTVVSHEKLEELANKVEQRIPKDLKFCRFGDRHLQIKRYLIEKDLDISQAVTAIKRTASWRAAWNADTIKASDIMEVIQFASFVAVDASSTGQAVLCGKFDISQFKKKKFPPLERVVEVFIFVMDRLVKVSYDNCVNNNLPILIKDYGKALLNAEFVCKEFVKQAFPMYPRTIMEILTCHYPCFLSLSDIYVSDDPNFVPDTSINSHTLYAQNAPSLMKGLFNVLKTFFPERWARQVVLNTDFFIPPCFDPELVPEQNGGKKKITHVEWLAEIAAKEGCSLETPTVHELSERVLEQYGNGNKVKAYQMPNAYARASMWKMTNAGGRWHHYYFVLTKEHILYYFSSADDVEIRTGILLEDCSIVVDSSAEAIKREGQDAITQSLNVNEQSTLVGADVPEKSGSSHLYHFILQTPSRPYTFACNTLGQKIAWMIILKRSIAAANKDFNNYCCFFNKYSK